MYKTIVIAYDGSQASQEALLFDDNYLGRLTTTMLAG